MIQIYIGNCKDIKNRGNIRNIWRRYWNSDMIAGGKEQFVEAGKYKKEISIKKLAKSRDDSVTGMPWRVIFFQDIRTVSKK
jgi:hypothetical protein